MPQYEFEGFPSADWKSATSPELMEAVVSIRELADDGFHRVNVLLKKEEALRRQHFSRESLGESYKQRVKEAKKAGSEVFNAFLKIAVANRSVIAGSCVLWAFGQTHAVLGDQFGFGHSRQPFWRIKGWLKEYCDGRDQADMSTLQTHDDWWIYVFREQWRAPAWLRAWASKFFGNNSLYWDRLDESKALERLEKEDTEKLLDGIAGRFWIEIEAALTFLARTASINLALAGAVGGSDSGGNEPADEKPDIQPKKERPRSKLSEIRRTVIREVASTGVTGEAYCKALQAARLKTPIEWQQAEGCPKEYPEAYAHPVPTTRKKWRNRIADEKYKATKN